MPRYPSFEEGQALWLKRSEQIMAGTPKTFNQAATYYWTASQLEIHRKFYNTPSERHSKSGGAGLLGKEKLRKVGVGKVEVYNRASSIWRGQKTNYAATLFYGRKAMTTPTRTNKKHYAWLWNKSAQRPRGKDAWKTWLEMAKEGKAVLAKRVKAIPGYRWRSIALAEARPKINHLMREYMGTKVWRIHSAVEKQKISGKFGGGK